MIRDDEDKEKRREDVWVGSVVPLGRRWAERRVRVCSVLVRGAAGSVRGGSGVP